MNPCIIFGGQGEEYFVSLSSVATILREIDTKKYNITKIGITRDGKWYKTNATPDEIENDKWQRDKEKLYIDLENRAIIDSKNERIIIDKAFFVMHGDFGENGTLQGLFDLLGIKYVGSDRGSSGVCYNKHLSKLIAMENGILVSDFFTIKKCNLENVSTILEKARNLSYPLFVKPSESGSSVGISRVEDENDLIDAIKNAFKYSNDVLLERAIDGCECEIAVSELNGKIILSEVGKIVYEGSFYDYETKYKNSSVRYEIPAKIDTGVAEIIKNHAKTLFRELNCHKIARIDFFVDKENRVIFNEINTMPGFTKSSMYPMLMSHAGIEKTELIDILLAE